MEDLDVDSFRPKKGRRPSPEYECWVNMRQRCNNFLHPSFADYGARGITVCEAWESFETFLRDVGPRPTKRHSLERKDNAKGYGKDNCVWATKKTQQNNTRANVLYEHAGESRRMADWAAIKGISEITIYTRLHRGWTFAEAITTPVLRTRKPRRKHTPKGKDSR